MVDLEDEVPPLEDMTESIQKMTFKKKDQNAMKPKTHYLEATKDETVYKNEKIAKMLGKSENCPQENVQKKSDETVSSASYCGFKKGFLTGSSEGHESKQTSATQQKTTGVKFDVTKNDNAKEKEKVFSEVQEEMKKQIPLLESKDWVTEDLLTKIMSHPKLSKQFMDPQFSQAIAKFQSNPQEVMEMCATNEELREFIQEFCAIMGNHFTGLADKQDMNGSDIKPTRSTKTTPTSTKEPAQRQQKQAESDEAKMKKILADPEVARILQSPRIQQLFTLLKSDPVKAQRMLQTADGEFRHHIHKLIDVGLLQMAR